MRPPRRVRRAEERVDRRARHPGHRGRRDDRDVVAVGVDERAHQPQLAPLCAAPASARLAPRRRAATPPGSSAEPPTRRSAALTIEPRGEPRPPARRARARAAGRAVAAEGCIHAVARGHRRGELYENIGVAVDVGSAARGGAQIVLPQGGAAVAAFLASTVPPDFSSAPRFTAPHFAAARSSPASPPRPSATASSRCGSPLRQECPLNGFRGSGKPKAKETEFSQRGRRARTCSKSQQFRWACRWRDHH